ncbi:putative pre-tape measure chaperone protein [Pseudomonas phage UAntarctica]|nr:putative pre-tape measure chaperone protein [Pseudomonas phage UAntarctica]
MLELTSIAIDPELAANGTWLDYMGGRFLVARQGPAHQERLGQLFNEHADLIKSGTPEGTAKLLEIYQRAFADTCLLNWEGVVEKGEALPYTPDVGFKVLSDVRYAELAAKLEQFSLMHSNYRTKVEAEVAQEVKSSAAS